jgi:hypothetical protein
VTIYVLSNPPSIVTIYAPDPVAVAGTAYTNGFKPPTSAACYYSGTNTATFLVRRDSETNANLTVYYSIGGTASNGMDYEAISGYVTILAGQQYALIAIVPLDVEQHTNLLYDTVILSLLMPTNTPPAYTVGSPAKAGAIILDASLLPILPPSIRNFPDNSTHVSLPAGNGMTFSVQISTDLLNWLPVCTNMVLKGSAQFVDPNGGATSGLFYRIVPAPLPAY